MWSLKHSVERQVTKGLYLSPAGSAHRKELRVVTLPQLLANSTDTMKEELLQRPATTQPKKRRDVFYFAHTRTASHVLCRLLSTQPGWEQSDYHFKRAFDFARDAFGWGPLNDASKQQREGFGKLLQQGFDEIQDEREAAANKVGRPICAVGFVRFDHRLREQNKAFFLKEHTFYTWEPSRLSQSMWGVPVSSPPFTAIDKQQALLTLPDNAKKTNPTIFPDAFVESFRAIFLIRHPALSFESWYRAESAARHVDIFDKSWSFYTSFQYSRQMHDWYLSRATAEDAMPIVIEADDMMENRATIDMLCEMLGMDKRCVLHRWDVIQAPVGAGCRELKFMSGYWNSTSVDRSKSSRGLDLVGKRGDWREEFGVEVGDELWRLVQAAMPDYEYLKGKRI
jgi:hypothetical protein